MMWMMDFKLLISFVIISLLPGYVLSCKTDEDFEANYMVPYNAYLSNDFWTNICSDEGKKVFSDILSQIDCPTENADQITFLEKFKERFDPFEMNIEFACELQTEVCQSAMDCLPQSLYTFQGNTVYNFYEYFCGPKSLRYMFTCLKNLTTDCPVTVELFSVFKLSTPSGIISYSDLSTKIVAECIKLQDQDVQCIQSKVGDISQCGILSIINMTILNMTCTYTTKTKACISEKCGGTVATFYDELYRFLTCSLDKGQWSGWTAWSTCTATCDQGITLRTRSCSLEPISGQQVCEGESTEITNCTITETCPGTPVDGEFGFWNYWSECDQNCGGGSRTRTRSCNNPPPSNGGNDCEGETSQSESCNEQECPGEYSPWGSWSTCSKSCGQGSQTRTRTCEGGGSCTGPSTESTDCVLQACPVDGGFSEWQVWSACTITCGGGTRTRKRTCTNPSPEFGGKQCEGEANQSEACNEQKCPAKRCPSDTNSYGTWPETEVGSTANLGCKKQEEKGSYSRRCGPDRKWEEVTGQCEIDPEVLNEIDEELQKLANSEEDISEDMEVILKNLSGLSDTVNADTSVSTMTQLVNTAKNVVSVVESSNAITDQGTTDFLLLMDNVINPETKETWKKSEVDGSDVLDMVERYIKVVQKVQCGTINTGTVNRYNNKHMYTEIGKVSGGVKFPNEPSDSFLHLQASTLTQLGVSDPCFGATKYTSAGDLIHKGFSQGPGDSVQVVNSEILSTILQEQSGVLDPPLLISLKMKNTSLVNPVCVFWDFDIAFWSSDGCSVTEYTGTDENVVCQCSHLTNFAVLMSPSGTDSTHTQTLSIISAVGCAISMVCLILTIGAHAMVWRLVRSDRAIILMNLCVALLVAFGVFLAGVNRTESRTACAAIAAIIQYLFLAVFFFMLLIGIEILICVVHVFVTKFRIKVLLPVAWLAPAVIVGISLGVTQTEGYGNDKFCWLDTNSGLIWAFIGPAAFILFVNFIIILIVFKKMASSAVLKSKTSTTKIKTGLRSLCVLLPLMGLTWVFGILSLNNSTIFFQYIFSILNTLQGLFIFLFHCVFNRQMQDAIKRQQERRKSLQTFSSDLRKQSRSLSKDEKQRNKSGDRRASDIKGDGFENNAFTGKDERKLSRDYDADDWDRVERKLYHKKIRRGTKLWK